MANLMIDSLPREAAEHTGCVALRRERSQLKQAVAGN
jgi:hypothetical protein